MNDINRGSISCPHGYVRAGECSTCRPLVKLKTLPMVKWERGNDGGSVGNVDALDGTQYVAKVVASLALNGGFYGYLIANGSMIHQSEHGSRNEAEEGVGQALRRAIDLREGA